MVVLCLFVALAVCYSFIRLIRKAIDVSLKGNARPKKDVPVVMRSENHALLVQVVPELIARGSLLTAKNSFYQQIENVQSAELLEQSSGLVEYKYGGLTFYAKAVEVKKTESIQCNLMDKETESVTFPMSTFQEWLGEDAKLNAIMVEKSSILVLMVDKPHDKVTSEVNLMNCVSTLIGELCDMDDASITSIACVRLPLILSGSFVLSCQIIDNSIRVDIYNEDLTMAGFIDGMKIDF